MPQTKQYVLGVSGAGGGGEGIKKHTPNTNKPAVPVKKALLQPSLLSYPVHTSFLPE